MIEIVSAERCTACNICVKVCPTNVFDIVQGKPPTIARQDDCQIGYIGPSPALVNVTGWALANNHLQREIAPLGYTTVTTHTFANGPDLNEAFFAGSVDVGIYGDTPSIVARARGLKNKLIGFDQIGMDVWLLTPQNGVTDIRQLEGKTVAVALGSYMHRYVIGRLKEAGILKSTKNCLHVAARWRPRPGKECGCSVCRTHRHGPTAGRARLSRSGSGQPSSSPGGFIADYRI